MTVSELNAKLFALGGAPEGTKALDIPIKGRFCNHYGLWSPASDIATAIEMAERMLPWWQVTRSEKTEPQYKASGFVNHTVFAASGHGEGPTPAFALSDAVLKALEAKE